MGDNALKLHTWEDIDSLNFFAWLKKKKKNFHLVRDVLRPSAIVGNCR